MASPFDFAIPARGASSWATAHPGVDPNAVDMLAPFKRMGEAAQTFGANVVGVGEAPPEPQKPPQDELFTTLEQQGFTFGEEPDVFERLGQQGFGFDKPERTFLDRTRAGQAPVSAAADTLLDAAPGLREMIKGVNKGLARAISDGAIAVTNPAGLAADLVGLGEQLYGASSRDQANKILTGFMNKIGIQTDPKPGSLGGQIGEELVPNLIALAAIAATAGAAATALPGKTGQIAKTLHEFMQAHPVGAMVQELGATTGSVIGERAGAPFGKQAEVTNRFVGSLMGGIGAGAVYRAVRSPFSAAMRMLAPAERQAVASGEIGDFQAYAKTVVQGELARIDQQMRQPLLNLRNAEDPAEAAQALIRGFDRADTTARNTQNRLWNESAAKTASVRFEPIADEIGRVRKNMALDPQSVQLEQVQPLAGVLRNIDRLTAQTTKAGTMKTQKLRTVVALLKDVEDAQLALRMKPAGFHNVEAQLERLDEIQDVFMWQIRAQLPDNRNVITALEFMDQRRQLFSQGPLQEAMAKAAQLQPGATREQVVRDMMRNPDALAAIREATLRDPAITAEYDNFIRSDLRAQLEQAAVSTQNPKAVEQVRKWFLKNDSAIKQMADAGAEMQISARQLEDALEAQTKVEQDLLTRLAGMPTDPVKGKHVTTILSGLMGNPNAPAFLRELARNPAIRSNPQAMNGLKSAVLATLLERSAVGRRQLGTTVIDQVDPAAFLQTAKGGFAQDVLKAVFTEPEIARIMRNAELASTIASGRSNFSPRIIIARIAGATMGSHLASIVGTGNVQTPAITSGLFRSIAEKGLTFRRPSELFVRSLFDPHWEKILRVKAPSTLKDARKGAKYLRRVLAVVNTAVQEIGDEQ